MSGGLRVKKIEDIPGDGGLPVTREFKYGDGTLTNVPVYTSELTTYKKVWLTQHQSTYTVCADIVATSQSKFPLATTSGSYVSYSKVTEVLSNGAENEYSYIAFSGSNYPALPFAPIQAQDWRRGFLLGVKSYAKEGEQLLLAKEVSNSFTENILTDIWGLKVGRTSVNIFQGLPPPNVFQTQLIPDAYTFYNTTSVFFGLGTSTEKIYPEPGNLAKVIETKKEYIYDPDHCQLIEEKETLIDGTGGSEVKLVHRKYPPDYSFTSAPVGAEKQGIKKLQDLHVVSVPVEEYVVKQYQNSQNQVSNQRVISAMFRSFKTDMPYQDQIYQIELSQPIALSDFTPSSILNNAVQKSPLYKSRVKFLAYDENGNLLAQQKTDDAVTSYLWGYDNMLPVAEVKNATNESSPVQLPVTSQTSLTITDHIGDTPILSAFELSTSQQLSVTVGLIGTGSNIPPSPLVNFILKKIDGTTASGITGAWGQHTSSISVGPGTYQWYYNTGDISFGPDLTSIYLSISNSYSSGKAGSRIFYTSFEDDGNYTTNAYTGQKAWQGAYTVYLPAQNGNYKLTYMKWNGGSPENWEYVIQDISVTSGTVQPLTIGNASSILDEIRFYPADAQMTTFAYKPEVGMTASVDANCSVMYYDYDSFGRLKYLKDIRRNVVKSFEYHYKGE